ncbi:MAG: histidine utilization repressor [Pseudomonadota bacterium]
MDLNSQNFSRKIDDSPLPLYQKLKSLIATRIQKKEWLPGQQIPSEAEFVETYGISRMTASRALRELTSEGYLVRVQGVGTFVARRKPKADMLQIRSIADEIREQGGLYSNRVDVLVEEPASEPVAEEMEIAPGEKVYHSIIVHLDRGAPIQIEDRYVGVDIAPEYIRQNFTRITPTQYLLDIAPPAEVEHLLEAILPDKKTMKLLKIGPREPCLVLHRRTWTAGRVVTSVKMIYPGSRYRIGGHFRLDESGPAGSGPRGFSFIP